MIEDETFVLSDLSVKIFQLFNAIRETSEKEMMKFTIEELNTLKIFYGKDFTYPLFSDVEELLEGTPDGEYLH